MKNKIYTSHHLLTQDFGGLSRPNNLVLLRDSVHKWIHSVFSSDTPIQRIRRLIETDKTVMKPEVYQAINETLRKFEWIIEYSVYEEDCIDPDKFIRRLTREW